MTIQPTEPMLNTNPNLGDDFYQSLLDLHRDLSDEESAILNAKLVLLLANHVGDGPALREMMRAAREDLGAAGAVR
jgi:hypothetical protein